MQSMLGALVLEKVSIADLEMHAAAARALKVQRKKRRVQRRAHLLGVDSPEEGATHLEVGVDENNCKERCKDSGSGERARSQIALLRVGVILAMTGCVLMGVGFLLKPAYASFEVGVIALLFGVYVLVACGCHRQKEASQRDVEGQKLTISPPLYSLVASQQKTASENEPKGMCNQGFDPTSDEVVIQNELAKLKTDPLLIGLGYMIPSRVIARPKFEQIPEESEPESAASSFREVLFPWPRSNQA